jgi:hypothetical protein
VRKNSIKRVKRVAFGFALFRNYHVSSPLDADNGNWLRAVTPR